MTTEQIIKGIIANRTGVKPELLFPGISFTSMGANYEDILLIVMEIEDVFKIKITDNEIEDITNLRGAVMYVDKKLAGK